MADEKVTIKIDVKADTSQIDRVRKKLAELCAQAEACEKQLNDYSGATAEATEELKDLEVETKKGTKTNKEHASSIGQVTKEQKRLGGIARDNRSAFDKLAGVIKTPFRLAMIGAGLETVALSLALSSVNGLLIVGRALVKGYHMAMSGLAKAAAAAGVALATVAAAQRQYIAAQATGRYGGSFAASAAGLRTLTGDARLASLGMKSLTGAFQAASKNAPVTQQTANAIAGLLDFAYLSGDIEKGTAALANFVSLVQKGGPGGKGVADAAKELGPEFEKAFKQVSRGGKATSKELMQAFAGGGMAKAAGVGGAASAVQGSLVGQLKASFTQLQIMFGDLGWQLLGPMQEATRELGKILVRTFRQLSPLLMQFGPKFADAVVNATDKLSGFLVKLMREYVPRVTGFFDFISSSWEKLTNGFERFARYLNQFSAASKIINTFFGKIFKQGFGAGLKNNFEKLAGYLEDNRENFEEYGDQLRDLIRSIFDVFDSIRKAFFKALPVINALIGGITGLITVFRQLLDVLTNLGPYAALFGLVGTGMIVGGRKRGRRGFLTGSGGGGFLAQNRGPITAALAAGTVAGGIGSVFGGDTLGTILGMGGLGAYAGRKLARSAAFEAFGNRMASRYSTPVSLGVYGPPAPTGGRVGRFARGMQNVGTARLMGAGAATAIGGTLTDIGTDFVENRYGNTAITTGVGAAGGAATGAAAGAFLAPMTGGLSIVAGAAIGAIVGAISGFLKSGEAKRKAREAGSAFTDDYVDGLNTLLGANDFDRAGHAIDAFRKQAEKLKDSMARGSEAYKQAVKDFAQVEEELRATQQVGAMRTRDLAQMSGLANEEIQNLANTAEVSLGNSMLSLADLMHATGIAVRRFGEDWKYYLADTFAADLEQIQRQVEILDSPAVKDAIANSFVETLKNGAPEEQNQAFADFLTGILTQNQLTMGTAGADLMIMQTLGGIDAFGTGAAFQPGGFFTKAGITPADFSEDQISILNEYLKNRRTSVASGTAQNIASQLASQGFMLAGMTVEQFAKVLEQIPYDQLLAFSEQAANQSLFVSEGGVNKYGTQGGGGAPMPQQLLDVLKPYLPTQDTIELTKTSDRMMQESADKWLKGTGVFTGDTGTQAFTNAVKEFQLAVDDFQAGGDTASPRRNIVNTLGAHSQFDMMIAGNRTLTSGYRTWGLGSGNSDHAAGRAYDLVGQNLGLYQMAVKANGGYAEFHGGASGRHLHVVPNISNHIGDDATPVMRPPMNSTSSSSTITNNFVINQQPGQNSEALAAQIMEFIEKAQRSNNERY